MRSFPGWTEKINEISNGVFKVTLTADFSHVVEVIDRSGERAITKAYSDAFEIEKQYSKNRNKFLYDLSISQLADARITATAYNDKVFGSWMVEIKNSRIVYDGKDGLLVRQTKKDDDWFYREIIQKDEVTYPIFLSIINSAS